MIIKKFQGNTEEEAILAAKEEMGSNAIVMNICTTKQKGIFGMFRKDMVEVTAALEEKEDLLQKEKDLQKEEAAEKKQVLQEPKQEEEKDNQINKKPKEDAAFEKRLVNIQSMLENHMKRQEPIKEEKEKAVEQEERENLPFLRLVYKHLIDNDVQEMYVNQIFTEVERGLKKEASLESVLAAVYQKIILKLGEPDPIVYKEGQKKVVFFVGPTGVGKTTTIAKLVSEMKLKHRAKIALMTADTYRISAVEQLRTYASILDIPLKIVYSESDLTQGLEELKEYDMIFIDTAGRSHKNKEQCAELFDLIASMEQNKNYEMEISLVLSVTTKYKDLVKICEKYSQLGKYRIIFTKLDETSSVGNILNIAILTHGTLSYTASGQNVPDDISVINVQNIAKRLLGRGED